MCSYTHIYHSICSCLEYCTCLESVNLPVRCCCTNCPMIWVVSRGCHKVVAFFCHLAYNKQHNCFVVAVPEWPWWAATISLVYHLLLFSFYHYSVLRVINSHFLVFIDRCSSFCLWPACRFSTRHTCICVWLWIVSDCCSCSVAANVNPRPLSGVKLQWSSYMSLHVMIQKSMVGNVKVTVLQLDHRASSSPWPLSP